MSDTRHVPRTRQGAWVHASEVAHWTVLLLAWLWLGEQGMRLGWSLASGVLAVALWWAARLFSRGRAWALESGSAWMGLLGLLSAWGVWWPDFLSDHHAAHAGLLAVAVVWGVWCGLIETRSQTSTFTLGPVAWHPVVAAALAYGVWRMPGSTLLAPLGVSAMLALCAAVLHARDRSAAWPPGLCRGVQATLPQVLPGSAMGLMMGSLWLGNGWCAGLNWSLESMASSHLVLMAGLPALVAVLTRWWGPADAAAAHERLRFIGLACLVLGPVMFLGDSGVHGVLAMLLPSLAWAVHLGRHRMPPGAAVRCAPGVQRGLALLLGPGLLAWVGVLSPWQGPLAMQSALALLGVLAAVQILQGAWRKALASAHRRRLSAQNWHPSGSP
ncbi:hypothetical protein ACHEXK_15390 [Limnohabitans sp. DCL3]|uniref:hypothetical protein n=1 Tax=Limnohabitans sp. DCL3 TaxID=3374103 RepID=UPI003A89B77C